MSTYSQLRQIIPPDQALANKSLQAGLEQVKNIFDTVLPTLAAATEELESNVGLEDINALTQPLPDNVIAYFTNTLATGSGPDGLLLLTDVLGSIAGWNTTSELTNTTATLNSMTSQGDFNLLTNVTNGVYTVMETTITGVYTTEDTETGDWTTTIPSGLPGAGSYVGNSVGNSIATAFSDGLNPSMASTVNSIVSANSGQVANTTASFDVICNQLQTQNTNLALAGVDFANLIAGQQPWSLVYSLPSNGLDIVEGGAAYVLQSVSNTSTQGGQAMISTMREARNQQRLSAAGVQTDVTISDQYPEPPADLGDTQYNVAQASAQKII